MMEPRVLLAGSEKPILTTKAYEIGNEETETLTIVLRRKNEIGEQGPVTNAHFAANYGSADEDVRAVDTFCAQHGFTVTHVYGASRTIKVHGNLQALTDVFGAQLHGSETGRARSGSLLIPTELQGIILAVLGFDKRPIAMAHFKAHTNASGYIPSQVAKAYNFPAGDGTGQTIGIIELGGGFNHADLTKAWQKCGVGNVSVTAVGVDGAINNPTGNANSADGEVALDIQVIGGIAPGAKQVVYFAPNTDSGFLDAINAAVHDTLRKPSVISISWGAAESNWTAQAMNAMNAAFHDAALLGVTVCVASGDNGADDGVGDGKNHVDFPASSPWAVACGGTTLQINSKGGIQSEVVWNDGADGGATGGGYSSFFSRPLYYQAGIGGGTGRGVPDVAGNADPATGWQVIVDGQIGSIGGTSAVSPMVSALLAICNAQLAAPTGWPGKVFYLANGPQAFHDITEGNNGVAGLTKGYQAGKGWDACCGLGSPDGQKILALLKQHRGTK